MSGARGVIWKIPFTIEDDVQLVGPGLKPISVAMQFGQPCLWVETEQGDHTKMDLRIYGTGHPLDSEHASYQFLGTIQEMYHNHLMVWHIYWRKA